MENQSYLLLYSVDYPTNSFMRHLVGPMVDAIGIIEKEKFHPFIDSYRNQIHENLKVNRPGYVSIDQTVNWKETSPFLKGEIIFITKYDDEHEISLSVFVKEFQMNTFQQYNTITKL